MKIPVFQLLNLVLILVLLGFLAWYLWDMFAGKGYQPVSWKIARKKGVIPSVLLRLERNYADKVRFFSWWYQAERLKRENIGGAWAELGVYKGDSARILYNLDPARKLFLFDTFTGFTKTDLSVETGEAATYTTRNFADTSLQQVKEHIGGDENVIFCPGYFPDSAANLTDERFSLVNMDADLYKPTSAGLQFFYPRLIPGGVIFIHDYNEKWPGIIKAVDEFVREIPESPVLLPDMDGTLLLVKNKKPEEPDNMPGAGEDLR
jgi:O-methyltransferase